MTTSRKTDGRNGGPKHPIYFSSRITAETERKMTDLRTWMGGISPIGKSELFSELVERVWRAERKKKEGA